jgi:transketolase
MQHTALAPGERFYRYHSGAPDDDSYARAAAELISGANSQLKKAGAAPLGLESRPRPERAVVAEPQRMVVAYSRELVRQAEAEPRLVVLDADLELDCGLVAFRERFPSRFVECGIAEQDMVSQAGGMALRGLLPVVHSFACFLSTRPNEQIYNNATESTKIVYVASLAGLLPSGPGHSHQSVRDISALGSVPGLVMLEPSCEAEVAMAVQYSIAAASSIYLRLVSIPCQIPYQLPPEYRLEEGRGTILVEGDDAILFGYGPVLLPQAHAAAATLRSEHGIGLRVVNLPWLNRVDDAWLREVLGERRHVFTLDNHYVLGGQGQFLAARIAGFDLDSRPQVHTLGVTDIPVSGQNDEVLRAHGLDSAALVDAVQGVLSPR